LVPYFLMTLIECLTANFKPYFPILLAALNDAVTAWEAPAAEVPKLTTNSIALEIAITASIAIVMIPDAHST